MNFDDTYGPNKTSDLHPTIEPALEARVVAWVVGEASAFEIAELERLMAEKPELAIFKRRIEAVHGLVADAARPDEKPLCLSEARREKLLATIGDTTPEAAHQQRPANMPLTPRPAKAKRKTRWLVGATLALAACGIVALGIHVVFDEKTFSISPRELAEAQSRSEGSSRGFRLTNPDDGSSPPTEELRRQAMELAADLEKLKAEETAAEEVAARLSRPREAPPPPITFGFVDSPTLSYKGDAGRDAGIIATDTLSGSRLSTNLQDIGSSISVVTKQELADSAQSIAQNWSNSGAGGKPSDPDEPARPWSVEKRPRPNPSQTVLGGGGAGQVIVPRAVDLQAEAMTVAGYGTPAGPAASSPSTANFADEERAKDGRTMPKQFGGLLGGEAPVTPIAESASLSVVTRQQLADSSQIAVNDLFGGKQNTEGALQARDPWDASNAPGSDADSARLEKEKNPTREALEKHRLLVAQAETHATDEPVSTFSLHVSDASYRIAQAALARGEKPDPARIRPEEFYNAFDYGDPAPAVGEKIACRIEQAAHPFLQQRNLVRIAVRVPATGRGAGQPLRLTVLLDTSGSMEREDRIASVRRAMEVLASLLGANDRVTLIGFARQPRLLTESLPGNQATQLVDLVARTPFEGGTNVEQALNLAGELARRQLTAGAQNRIVLLTDGAANLGNADPTRLGTMIETLRQQGIAFDACGVGTDGLDDEILEALTRKGDGRYAILDKPEDADTGFAQKLAGAFRPAAQNVKLQVRFNPARVGAYRLIGFEQHRLREEDFRNDKVDAAELASEEAAVAIYQVEPLPQGEGELGDVFVRFRDAATGTMVERSWTMSYDARARRFDKAAPSMQLAGSAALLAEKIRGGAVADAVRLDELAPVMNALRGVYARDARVQGLATMFEQARRLYDN